MKAPVMKPLRAEESSTSLPASEHNIAQEEEQPEGETAEEIVAAEVTQNEDGENVAVVETAEPAEEELKADAPAGEGGEEDKEEVKRGDEGKAEEETGGEVEALVDKENIDNVENVEDVNAVPPVDVDVVEKVEKVDSDVLPVGNDISQAAMADGEEQQEIDLPPTQEEAEEVKGEEEAADQPEGEAVPGDEQPEEPKEEPTKEEREKGKESPLLPAEPELSRGVSPVGTDFTEYKSAEKLEATSPEPSGQQETPTDDDAMEGKEEGEPVEVEEVLEVGPKREEIIEKYLEALAERDILQQNNMILQHKLAEYFRKKKVDEKPDYDKNVADQEQRYLKYIAQQEDLRHQYQQDKMLYTFQIEELKEKCQEKKEKVDLERRKFIEYKQDVANNAIFGRSGKPIPPKDIEQYIANEAKKEQEVVNVRLENIKLKNKLKKKEHQLKSKEELAEGLHLIDFEQLKIENQTYNEKIEERNEELLKLRKKITSTVQILTHVKEKLQFVQGANAEQNNELQEVEASLAKSRDILSRTKQARDALRIDNQRLRQNSGLLGNEPLLRDFECQKDEAVKLQSQLEKLQMRHAELTLTCNQIRQKIDMAKHVTE